MFRVKSQGAGGADMISTKSRQLEVLESCTRALAFNSKCIKWRCKLSINLDDQSGSIGSWKVTLSALISNSKQSAEAQIAQEDVLSV